MYDGIRVARSIGWRTRRREASKGLVVGERRGIMGAITVGRSGGVSGHLCAVDQGHGARWLHGISTRSKRASRICSLLSFAFLCVGC